MDRVVRKVSTGWKHPVNEDGDAKPQITVVAVDDFSNQLIAELEHKPCGIDYLSADSPQDVIIEKIAASDVVMIICGVEHLEKLYLAKELTAIARKTCSIVAMVFCEDFYVGWHFYISRKGIDTDSIEATSPTEEIVEQSSEVSDEVYTLLLLSPHCLSTLNGGLPQQMEASQITEYLVKLLIRQLIGIISELGTADILEILGEGGDVAYLGVGIADGVARGAEASQNALLAIERQNVIISRLSGFIAIISGSSNMIAADYDKAVASIHEQIPKSAKLISTIVVDEGLGEYLRVLLIGKIRLT